jgi:phosphonate transport system substrate-binding protein
MIKNVSFYKKLLSFFTLISFVFFIKTPHLGANPVLGSRQKPLRVAIVPSVQANKQLTNFKPFTQCLEQETQLYFEFHVPSSYIAVVEAIGSKKVDVAFTEIMTYLLAKKKYGVVPLLKTSHLGRLYYRSMILVRKNDTHIQTIKDLDNKKFAFSDKSSASSYIMPTLLMKKQQMKFSYEYPTGSMEAAIIALLQKKVDVAAGYYEDPLPNKESYDARTRLLATYPHVMDETRVLWLSEEIPNEPIIARAGLPDELFHKLQTTLKKCIDKHPGLINNIDTVQVVSANDKSYEAFSKLILSSGLDISQILNKK